MIKENMTEKEYRRYPAINFSSLSAFYNKGVSSPDHALLKIEFKSYFEFGKMFETLLQDTATGSTTFQERFFQSKVTGKMPDQLIQWIDEKRDLEEYIVHTKKGDRSGTYKTRHAFIDEAMENPGKIPVSTCDWDMLQRLVDNMMNCRYSDVKVGDLLANAKFQVPIIWTGEVDGIERKALVDCLVDFGNGEALPMDTKTAASFDKFGWMLKDKYWIQEIQYVEGVNASGLTCINMPFLVASKEAPFLAQVWGVDYGDIEWRTKALEKYNELCAEYQAWVDKGRSKRGWLPMTTKKLYLGE